MQTQSILFGLYGRTKKNNLLWGHDLRLTMLEGRDNTIYRKPEYSY